MDKFSWLSDLGYRVLIEQLRDGVFVIEDGMMAYVNPRFAEILGRPASELIGLPFTELISAEERALVWERHRARLSGEKVPEQYEIHLTTANGSHIFCALNISLVKTPQGNTVTIGSARDVTRQKQALDNLASSKMELESIFDQLPDVFYRTDMQGIITMISPYCFDTVGYRQDEMLGKPMSAFYETPEDRQKIVQAILDGGGKATKVEAGLRHKNGSRVWFSTNAFIRYDANHQPISIDGVARDISERKKMEDKLTALSRTDDLTGVYSRRYFMDKSETVLDVMRRYQRPVSMMMVDLDNFKKINDRYGHYAGDLALIEFTAACTRIVRESDVLGRLGGEEFGLILPETPIQSAQLMAERIRKATAEIEIRVDEHSIKITVSIGVVELGAQDLSLDNLMHRADLAMYEAKESGRNKVVTHII